jgi:hypothetical protein
LQEPVGEKEAEAKPHDLDHLRGAGPDGCRIAQTVSAGKEALMTALVYGLLVVAVGITPLRLLAEEPHAHNFRYMDADLRGADLHGKDLRGEWFQRANLTRANLQDANVSGVSFVNAKLDQANLHRTNFTGAHLGYAHLRNANLTGAILRRAILLSADLTGADLTGADLRGADLSSATLAGANVRGADLSDVGPLHDMRGHGSPVPNCVNLEGATYDRTTRWLPKFDPRKLGAVLVGNR